MGSTLTILENDDLLISGIYGEISGLAPDQTRQGNEIIQYQLMLWIYIQLIHKILFK